MCGAAATTWAAAAGPVAVVVGWRLESGRHDVFSSSSSCCLCLCLLARCDVMSAALGVGCVIFGDRRKD